MTTKKEIAPKKLATIEKKKTQRSPTLLQSSSRLKWIKMKIPLGRILTAEGWNRHNAILPFDQKKRIR